MNPHRLWPVLVVLCLFLGGVVRLEWVASHRDPAVVVIQVTGGGDEDLSEGAETDQSWQASAPLSPDHARARQLLRRGEAGVALDLYETLIASHDGGVPLLTEYAYALRQVDRCEEAEAVAGQAALLAPDDGSVQLSQALVFRCLGREDDAEVAFRRALELRPNHTPTRLAYGELLHRAGRLTESIAVLRPAAAAGGNRERARALAHLGRSVFESGDRDWAVELLDEAIERAPASVSIWIHVTRTYLSSDEPADHERAKEHAAQASRLAPQLAEPHSVLGRAEEKLDHPLLAIDAYQRAADLNPSYEYVRTRLVRLGLDEGNEDVARRAARELLSLNEQRADYHFLFGLVSSRLGDAEAARAAYRQAIALEDGDYPEAWYNLGILERAEDEHDASKQAYLNAIDLRPDYPQAWNNLGLVHYDLEEFEEATEAFLRAIDVRRNYASAWINLARTYAAVDDYEPAADALERARVLTPDNRTVRLRLGVAYRRLDRANDAIRVYQSLVRDEPRYVNAWFNLGIALSGVGRRVEAMEAYATALENDPEHGGAMENLGMLEAEMGQIESAFTRLTGALDREPSDVELRFAVAQLAERRGDLYRCAREVKLVLLQQPDFPEAPALQARCEP